MAQKKSQPKCFTCNKRPMLRRQIYCTICYKKVVKTHGTIWAFTKKFGNEDGWKMKGWKMMQAMERFAKKHREIIHCWCDDNVHAGSDLWLIPQHNFGISVLYIPQCTDEDPTMFFLYQGAQAHLIKSLMKLKIKDCVSGETWEDQR